MTATIVPYNDEIGNAIRNVLFIFQFATPVSAKSVLDLRKGDIHQRLKEILPKADLQRQQTMVVGEGGAVTTEDAVVGCKFEQYGKRGDIALGLSVLPAQISIVCGEYTRWEAVRTSVEEVLQLISPWLREHEVEVSTFTLQYLDEFKVTFEEGDHMTLVDLFSVDSPFLVRNFADLDQEFHSQHGYFTKPDFNIEGRLLNNINVGVNRSPDGESTIVQIQMIHRYDAKAVLELVDSKGVLSPLLAGAYEYLHQENKRVLRSLLTESAKELIKLDTPRTE